MPRIYRKPKLWKARSLGTAVIGDVPVDLEPRSKRVDRTARFSKERRQRRTPAEVELERILNAVKAGVLRRRFIREWALDGRWIFDFFFRENRLAIEVDGSIHRLPEQKAGDTKK